MVHSSAGGNDMLSTLELTDFIDDVELFAGPECLAFPDSGSLSVAASKPAHGNISRYLLPTLPDAELTTMISLLVEEPYAAVALTTGASGDSAMDSMESTCLLIKKKSSTQRQREEIAYLRDKVRELKDKVSTITQKMADAASSESVDCAIPVDSVWVATAKHQLEQKKRAEEENMKLREKLAGEISFAKSLGRMLRKRKIWDGLQEKRKMPRFIELRAKEDSDIFDMLTRQVGERVRALGVVPDAKGFPDGTSSSSSSSDIFTSSGDGMCIDLFTSATVPFDFHNIADDGTPFAVLSREPFLFGGCEDANEAPDLFRFHNTQTHVLNQTEDCLFRKEVGPLQLAGDTHQMTKHAVCKRVIQENRVVILWEIHTETKGPSGVQRIQVRSKGYGEILRGESTVSGSPSSLLRSTLTVIPHLVQDTSISIAFNDDGTAPKVPKRKSEMVGLLSELLIASHEQHSQMSRQFIENALFDELIQGKKDNENAATTS